MLSFNPQTKPSPGELLKRLRIRTGLTQAELGLLIPISEKMIRNWETDTNLPKASNLRKLIEICLLRQVFIGGIEQDEAANVWNAVKAVFDATTRTYNEYPAFDEGWFENLPRLTLVPRSPETAEVKPKPAPGLLRDWGEAPAVGFDPARSASFPLWS